MSAKHIAITEELYDVLKSLKPDDDRSFTFVIKKLIRDNNEKDRIIEERDRTIEGLNKDIENLMKIDM